VIKGFCHVGISVSDLDRSVGFYRDAFAMTLVAERHFGKGHTDERYERVLGLEGAAGRVATLQSGNLEIELFEFKNPKPKAANMGRPVCDHGISHFCLHVTDIESEYARLKQAGVEFHCPPQYFDKIAAVTYGRDPDGNAFELLEEFNQG